jgi:hypothetical protein
MNLKVEGEGVFRKIISACHLNFFFYHNSNFMDNLMHRRTHSNQTQKYLNVSN